MAGLSNSRHAPWRASTNVSRSAASTPPPPPLTITPALTGRDRGDIASAGAGVFAALELSRYTKIVRRLKWKLPFLAQAYNQAIDRIGRDPAAVTEAELMFKLDFFEYYMLVERALVHLLGVFGINVPRGPNSPGGETASGRGGLSASLWKSKYSGTRRQQAAEHRYHANVLETLDDRQNPLHAVLGTGEVRRQLGRAKDLRNRWKTAGDDDDHHHQSTVAAPLDTYDLKRILDAIFEGFDAAFLVAEQFVRGEVAGDVEMDLVGADPVGAVDWAATEEEQWEFMVDAMDWEAV
ncbi:hypothetical protein QBC47DRAFT_297147 [Echria macrotheca]|uniref:Uncharacterized protein n=1 Tax=Echria macrotheca TaxID=438768 RepID=A0AAJ0BEU0_9PEZI|nr:hypothetical protein QBC47DRAFT_297147 [Echria macrotheca]